MAKTNATFKKKNWSWIIFNRIKLRTQGDLNTFSTKLVLFQTPC